MNTLPLCCRASLLVGALFVLAGCSKEKAIALRTAAEAARTQAIAALAGARDLMERSIALPAETQDQRVKRATEDFGAPGDLDAEALNVVMTESEAGENARRVLSAEFRMLERKYLGFAAMFRALPEGSYRSAEAVKKAEAHAIHLAAEFMTFAQNVGRLPGVFNGERAAVIAAVNRSKKLPSPAREELLRAQASAALQLRQREREAKAAVIVECLRAAEAFRSTAELARGYGKLSPGEMLVVVRELLSLANDISGKQSDVSGLLERYRTAEQRLRADPYWKPILDLELQP